MIWLQVVMHCLATYLDSQLPAFTDRPDRRPFTGQYLVKCPEKAQPSSHPLIVEVQINPPHYKLVMGADEYELPKVNISFFLVLKLDAQSVLTIFASTRDAITCCTLSSYSSGW